MRDRYVAMAWPGSAGDNRYVVLSPGGKELGADLHKGLEAWARLPAKERKPDPKKLPVVERYDAAPTDPPKGGLILKTYMRGLQRDAKGKPHPCTRYLVAGGAYGYPAEPQGDHLWVTAEEWKSLLPKLPKKGATVAVPPALVTRIGMFHLSDLALGAPCFWPDVAGKLTLTVTEVTPAETRMRLDGKIVVGDYPVQFLGYVHYGNKTKACTRFDAVALGRDDGEKRSKAERDKNISYEVRKGWAGPLLAVAFELVSGERTIDRVPPYAIMYNSERHYARPYFVKAK